MDDLNKIIIERIKVLRKRLNISQEKLSLSAELDRNYINKLENGKFNLSVPTLGRIIAAFDMSYQDFFNFNQKEDNSLELVNKLSPKAKEDLLIQCIKINDLFNKE